MGIVSLVCKQCGGQLTFQDTQTTGFCPMCGTKVLIQEEITNVTTNIKTTHNYNVQQSIVKNIVGREKTEADEYIINGNVFLNIGKWDDAQKAFDAATKANPSDCNGWIGLAKATLEKEDLNTNLRPCAANLLAKSAEYLEYALKVAKPEQQNEITAILENIKYLIDLKDRYDLYTYASGEYITYCKTYNINLEVYKGCAGIDREAFKDCKQLEKIILPEGVKSIGNSAFPYSLTEISLPESLNYLGEFVFSGSKLNKITLPSIIKKIPLGTFARCKNLTSITIPNGVTEIDTYAFNECTSLTEITIPESVTSIGNEVFSGWTKTQKINIYKKSVKSNKNCHKDWDKGCKAKINYL